jgi:hypothetical protein
VADPAGATPAPREIRAGSVALRAFWSWLRSLVRGLLGTDKTSR